MIPQAKLDFWIKHNKNVQLIGRHGVGKTSIVLEAWKRHGLRYLYFSAANMDPWIDLVGVPRERTGKHPKTGEQFDYIELVPPRALALDEVDAIFFDEYNRAPEKVRNATMQFIQFKEVNGRKYHNLRMVWTAINPPDTGEYNVQELDPAQDDRFHIRYNLPFRPDNEYFLRKYGDNGTKFVEWWHKLNNDTKSLISPRRLDYAAQIFVEGGDMEDVFPPNTNIQQLTAILNHGTIEEKVARLMSNPNTTEDDIRKFIQNVNNFSELKPVFVKNDDEAKKTFSFFAPYIEPENALAMTNDNVLLIDRFVENAGKNPDVVETLKEHSDKKAVIYPLLKGLVLKSFDYREAANYIGDESKQKEVMNTLLKKLEDKPDQNKAYAAAFVLQDALSRFPDIAKEDYVQQYRSKVLKTLEVYPNLAKYFDKVK